MFCLINNLLNKIIVKAIFIDYHHYMKGQRYLSNKVCLIEICIVTSNLTKTFG